MRIEGERIPALSVTAAVALGPSMPTTSIAFGFVCRMRVKRDSLVTNVYILHESESGL